MPIYINKNQNDFVTYENVNDPKRTLFKNIAHFPSGSDSAAITENGSYEINVADYNTLNLSVQVPPPGNITEFVTYTPSENISKANAQTINLTPVPAGKYYFLFIAVSSIPDPDSTLYWGLGGYQSNTRTNKATPILRPNGTLGTDVSAFVFEPESGALTFGGPYASFKKDLPYYIYYCILD